MKIAALLRKSPTKSIEEEKAIKKYKEQIKEYIKDNYNNYKIDWYIDVASGDDEKGRKALHRFFKKIKEYDLAICPDVDRFSRSWLGLKWFQQYFINSKCKLIFLDGTNLYDDKGNVNPEGYMFFFIKCAFAEFELIKIRKRTEGGRQRLRKNPKLWKKKYKGGKKGRKWKR